MKKVSFHRALALVSWMVGISNLTACYGPSQNFPVGSELWLKSNPEWSLIEKTGTLERKSVLVAVLDGGFDYNHPRLAKHLVPFVAPPESGRNYGIGFDLLSGDLDFFPHFSVLDPESGVDGSETMMIRDHGSHVAGLVTLKNERIGLLPIRVLPLPMDRLGDATVGEMMENPETKVKFTILAVEQVGKGVRLACQHGAQVLNLSLGIDYSNVGSEEARARIEAVVASDLISPIRNLCQNSLLVAAAGNESREMLSQNQTLPATLSEANILSVGALNSKGQMAYFSNQGKFVDVFMRGADIKSAVPEADAALPMDAVKKLSGTSMASPLAAHVAARVLIEAPMLSPLEVRALILNTADLKELQTERVPAPDGTSYAEGEVAPLPDGLPEKRMGLVVNPPRAIRAAAEISRAFRAGISTEQTHALRNRYLVAPFEHGNSPF